jgi:flagellar hook-basal body complex protein FliE
MADLRVDSTGFTPLVAPTVSPAAPRGATGFGGALGRALDAVSDLQLEAQDAAAALASGQPVDTAQTVLAIQKADIAFQFALQIRNKLLDAYTEVMRMQV